MEGPQVEHKSLNQSYGGIMALNAGTILMLLGFFMYLGGRSESVSIGLIFAGLISETSGFLLAYLGSRA